MNRYELNNKKTATSVMPQPGAIMPYVSPLSGVKYDFDICDIADPEDFQYLLEVLRNANNEDEVHLHINSGGGNFYTAVQICGAMMTCKAARVMCHAEGIVASAATMIFLSATHWTVSPLSTFMFHTSSSVTAGKMPDTIKEIEAHKSHLNTVCNTLYKDFLTDEEIDLVINKNDDLWMAPDEVEKRLNIVVEKHKERVQSETEQANLDDDSVDYSKEEIIEELNNSTKEVIIADVLDLFEQLSINEVPSYSKLKKMLKQELIDLYVGLYFTETK